MQCEDAVLVRTLGFLTSWDPLSKFNFLHSEFHQYYPPSEYY